MTAGPGGTSSSACLVGVSAACRTVENSVTADRADASSLGMSTAGVAASEGTVNSGDVTRCVTAGSDDASRCTGSSPTTSSRTCVSHLETANECLAGGFDTRFSSGDGKRCTEGALTGVVSAAGVGAGGVATGVGREDSPRVEAPEPALSRGVGITCGMTNSSRCTAGSTGADTCLVMGERSSVSGACAGRTPSVGVSDRREITDSEVSETTPGEGTTTGCSASVADSGSASDPGSAADLRSLARRWIGTSGGGSSDRA
jgi:hypothetical protein